MSEEVKSNEGELSVEELETVSGGMAIGITLLPEKTPVTTATPKTPTAPTVPKVGKPSGISSEGVLAM